MISAVGDDELGVEAIAALQRRSVKTSLVQVDKRSTGRVLVELDAKGVASYRFDENSAWDHLAWNEEIERYAANCQAVCFGTLGQRHQQSRQTITTFLKALSESALRIFDVNLRQPFFSDELILASLVHANVLKLNDDELPLVAKLCDCGGSEVEVMKQLAEKFQLRCIALTRGADGAVIVAGDAVSDLPGLPVNVVDTVGAGDAFTASMTLDLLAAEKLDTVNRRAIATASYVCSQAGATMSFPDELHRHQLS